MRDVLRDCLKVAAEAATGVVVVVDGARRRAEDELRGRVPEPLQEVVAGVVGVVRTEADKVWSRLGDGVVQVGVVLEFLEQQVRQFQGGAAESAPVADERGPEPSPGRSGAAPGRAEQAFPAPRQRTAAAPRPVRVVVDEDPDLAAAAERRRAAVPGMKKAAERRAAMEAAAESASAETASAETASAERPVPAEKPAPAAKRASAAKKVAAQKAPAKKVVARKPTAAGGAATKTATPRDASAKTPAAKTTPAKTSAAKTTTRRTTAAKTAPVKTTPAKTAEAKPAAGAGSGKPTAAAAKKSATKRAAVKRAQPKLPGTGDD